MKENFPNLVKEIDTSPGSREFPHNMNAKRPTSRHIIIEMPKVKDDERTLKTTEKSS